MKVIPSEVSIIGGGLTGLCLAYFLKQRNRSVQLLEARPRLGGRIYTHQSPTTAPQEMGATWLGSKHQELIKLLDSLDLGTFEQILGDTAIYEPISTSPPQRVILPPNDEPSFRIKGGSATLIQALAAHLNDDQIHTKAVVQSIEQEGDLLSVKTADHDFKSALVISTLPPYLLHKTIDISPALPQALQQVAQQTHTWMGDSIKVSLSYAAPFWRKDNNSGTIFSNVGPIPEMYDHSNWEDSAYALKGFLNGTYYSLRKAERLEMILRQLEKYFGPQVRDFTAYEEAIWRKEPFTFSPYESHILPHQNNGHPLYRQAYLDGKLWIAGSETAAHFPGYMEGAVQSARFISQAITS